MLAGRALPPEHPNLDLAGHFRTVWVESFAHQRLARPPRHVEIIRAGDVMRDTAIESHA